MYLCLRICASYSKGVSVNVYVILCLHICTSEWVLCDCVNCEHTHMPPVGIGMYVCLCVNVRSGVCTGDSRPSTHTGQVPGGGSSSGGGCSCSRETLLPACPAPIPSPYLPAASWTARTARSCGPGGSWGPSSCGVSCPWRAQELAREPKRSPTSPAAGPAAPGGRQRDARAATADAPSPS